MLIRDASIGPERRVDVRLGQDGLIAELGASLPLKGEETLVDAAGHALIPGLHDHHIHLLALAAAKQSVDCGAQRVTSLKALASVLKKAVAEGCAALRGVGYFEHEGPLIDRYWLDQISCEVPIRIQHRTGRLWILNSRALDGLDDEAAPEGAERDESGRLTGRFYHLDDWLRCHLAHSPPSLRPVSQMLARFGVTGVTDTGPDNDDSVLDIIIAAQHSGELRQSVLLMGNESLRSFRSHAIETAHCKLYLKESALPELDVFIRRIRNLHGQGRPVAIHCVTRVELQFALTAFAEAGVLPADRIEHASIADNDVIAQLARLKLTVVTQPHFVAERGDQYKRFVESDDRDYLYRGKGFLAEGVALAAGSDAPYGHADPWAVMRAAVERRTASGYLMHPQEALTPQQSLSLFSGHALSPGRVQRKIEVGQPADLCLLAVSWSDMLQNLSSDDVRATWCRGELAFGSAGE